MVLQALIYGLQQQLLKRKRYYESRCIPGSSEFAVKRVFFFCGGKLPVATGKMFSLFLLLSCSPLSYMFYPQRWVVNW